MIGFLCWKFERPQARASQWSPTTFSATDFCVSPRPYNYTTCTR